MTTNTLRSAKTHQAGQTRRTASPSAPDLTAATASGLESQTSQPEQHHKGAIASQTRPKSGGRNRLAIPTEIEARPDPAKWAAALAICAIQATFGLRPPVQLHRWVEPTIFEAIRVKADAAARINLRQTVKVMRPHLRRTSTFEPAPGRIEATVIVACSDQVRAVAIRLEWRQHHWQAVNLTLI